MKINKQLNQYRAKISSKYIVDINTVIISKLLPIELDRNLTAGLRENASI